jgi:MoxR-like ATPase
MHVNGWLGAAPADAVAGTVSERRPVLDFAERFQALRAAVEQIIRGKGNEVGLALTCLFSEGHLLIEDVPGVGKTTLARCLAASVDARCQRIQFTPDLLPSDVTGVSVYNQATRAFEFHRGPVFANILLGDEINRASPRTQSALLEVMEERRVTIDGAPHPVPRPFMVIATQNPVDMDGTYPLPEAQLDRFLMRIELGYPDPAAEAAVLAGMPAGPPVESLQPVIGAEAVTQMVAMASRIYAAPALLDYVVAIAAATRGRPSLRLGASPRASLGLLRAARVRAAAAGRIFVTPEDVKALAMPVLAHRLLLTAEAELRGQRPADILGEVLRTVPVPSPARASAGT